MKNIILVLLILPLLGCSDQKPESLSEQVVDPIIEAPTQLPMSVDSSAQIEMMSEFLNVACPQREFREGYEEGAPLSLDAYGAYFDNAKYSISNRVRRDNIVPKDRPKSDLTTGFERLTVVRQESHEGIVHRYETVVGTRFRPLDDGERYLLVYFASPERASIWREDCQAFLQVKTVSQYVQFNSALYKTRYYLSEEGRRVLTLTTNADIDFEFARDGNRQAVDPADSIDDWDEATQAVVMRTCYNTKLSNVDLYCTEHNLASPNEQADEIFVFQRKVNLITPDS